MTGPDNDRRNDIGLVAGIVLAAAGMFLLAQNLGFVPLVFFDILGTARRVTGPIALVILGAMVIVVTQRGVPRWSRPPADRRLCRSRSARVLSGVCGGLAAYLGLDPLLVRLAYLLVALVFGVWQGVVVYVILSMLVPEEPIAAPV